MDLNSGVPTFICILRQINLHSITKLIMQALFINKSGNPVHMAAISAAVTLVDSLGRDVVNELKIDHCCDCGLVDFVLSAVNV